MLVSLTLVAGFTLGTLRSFGLAFPDTGPLGDLRGGAEIGGTKEPGETFGAPFFTAHNDTSDAIVIESVRLVDATPGLRLLGAGGCDPRGRRCQMATGYHWPPRGLSLAPLEGYVMPPGGHLAVVAGYMATDHGRYRVEGVELTYRQGLRRFVTVMGPSLFVRVR